MAGVIASATGQYPIMTNLSAMARGAGIGVMVTVPNGVTATYTVQVSGDPQQPNTTVTNWNPHDTLGTSQTASANGNIAFPCTWIALNVTAISGGSITMNIVQPYI